MPNSLVDVLRRGVAPTVKASIGTAESGFWSRWGWNTGETWSGKTVTATSALQNDTVWSCVKLISEAVSTLPLGFYKRTAVGGREHFPSHPLYELLHYQPHPRMSAVNYWQAVSASILLWGNSYSEINRTSSGRITALSFLLPDRMKLDRDSNGNLEYVYQSGLVERRIPSRNMMHVKGFGTDGEVGLSAIQYGRNSIGSALAADQASDETFKDASRATGMVTMDSVLRPDQRDQIRDHVRQVSQKGGVYVLEKGATFQDLRFSPQDAELLSSRSFSVETICRWFRVPPALIGHGDKQSSWPTSTEAQNALFLRYVLRPFILTIEQEIRRSLLTPTERETYFAEFALEGFLRGESAARAAFYASAAQNGWMSRNEIRGLENLEPVEGGDELTCQSNLLPLDKLGTVPPGNPPPEEPRSNEDAP